VVWPALFNDHPWRVNDGDGLYRHGLCLTHDNILAGALFLVVAVFLPLALDLAIAVPELFLLLMSVVFVPMPMALSVIVIGHCAGRKAERQENQSEGAGQ
jgi:hypothetical protein